MSRSTFLQKVLEPPAYGWSTKNGEFYAPTVREIMSHWFSRMNIFESRKNWLPITGWVWNLALAPFTVMFFCTTSRGRASPSGSFIRSSVSAP